MALNRAEAEMPGPHNLGEVIARDAPRDGPWMVEIDAHGGERVITYTQLHAQADALARGLLRRGLARGARVGLLAANNAAYLIAFIGIMRAGMVAVPINFKLTRETIAHIESDSGIGLTLVDGERRHLVGDLPSVRIDDTDEWASLLDFGDHVSPVMRDDEFATILYTSGSTGRPKGVPLTHGSYVWGIDLLVATGPPMRGKRVLVAAPFFHMNGLLISLMTSVAGGTVVLLCRFSGQAYLKAAAAQHCEVLTSVPTMLALAAKETETIAGLDLSHVESIFTGSAPSTDALFDRMAQIFPNARVVNGYGTTETGPLLFGAHPRQAAAEALARLPGAAGRVEVGRRRERERRRAVAAQPPADAGLPESAAGDREAGRGRLVQQQRRHAPRRRRLLYFVGRDDDMFVCGGENIYPGEVESCSSAIRTCCSARSCRWPTRSRASCRSPSSCRLRAAPRPSTTSSSSRWPTPRLTSTRVSSPSSISYRWRAPTRSIARR